MSGSVLTNFYNSLDMMWKGMLGLFVICGFISVLIMVVAKVIGKPKTPEAPSKPH